MNLQNTLKDKDIKESITDLINYTQPNFIYLNKTNINKLVKERFKFYSYPRLKAIYFNTEKGLISSELTRLKPIELGKELNHITLIGDLIKSEIFISINTMELTDEILDLFENLNIGTLLFYNCIVPNNTLKVNSTISFLSKSFSPSITSKHNIIIRRLPKYKNEILFNDATIINYDITEPKSSLVNKNNNPIQFKNVLEKLLFEMYKIKHNYKKETNTLIDEIIIDANGLDCLDITNYTKVTSIIILNPSNTKLIYGWLPNLKSLVVENGTIKCDAIDLIQYLININFLDINIDNKRVNFIR